MNKMPFPPVDDMAALTDLANNIRVGSHPHLLPVLQVLLDGYDEYIVGGGKRTATIAPQPRPLMNRALIKPWSRPCGLGPAAFRFAPARLPALGNELLHLASAGDIGVPIKKVMGTFAE